MVTILFADIVGWTGLAGSMSSYEAVVMLNDLYLSFDSVVDRYPAAYKVDIIGVSRARRRLGYRPHCLKRDRLPPLSRLQDAYMLAVGSMRKVAPVDQAHVAAKIGFELVEAARRWAT